MILPTKSTMLSTRSSVLSTKSQILSTKSERKNSQGLFLRLHWMWLRYTQTLIMRKVQMRVSTSLTNAVTSQFHQLSWDTWYTLYSAWILSVLATVSFSKSREPPWERQWQSTTRIALWGDSKKTYSTAMSKNMENDLLFGSGSSTMCLLSGRAVWRILNTSFNTVIISPAPTITNPKSASLLLHRPKQPTSLTQQYRSMEMEPSQWEVINT